MQRPMIAGRGKTFILQKGEKRKGGWGSTSAWGSFQIIRSREKAAVSCQPALRRGIKGLKGQSMKRTKKKKNIRIYMECILIVKTAPQDSYY